MSNNILNEKEKDVKEGFSDWRQDLSEVIGDVKKNTNKSEDIKVTEREITNKITICPTLGEAVEELGGTLLEMVEIEDFECAFDELSESDIFFLTDDLIEEVVEEVFIESLQEGYNVFEIENTLLESLDVSSALLNEAKVTYGHDTDVKSDRLEKVKSAVKKVGKGILRGAGYVAGTAVRGAKAVGRELSAGYKRGRYGSGGSSDSDSSSRSSDSDSSPDSSSSGGSSRVTQGKGSSRPGLLGRIGSALKKGLRRIIYKGAKAVERGAGSVARRTADRPKVTQGKDVETQEKPNPRSKGLKPTREPGPVRPSIGTVTGPASNPKRPKKTEAPVGTPENPRVGQPGPEKRTPKPQAKTTTIPAKPSTEEQRQAVIRATRRNPNLSKSDAERISAATPSKEERRREARARMSAAAAKLGLDEAHYSLATGKVEPGKPGEAHTNAISDLAAKAKTKKKTRKPVGTSRRGGSFKPSSPEEAEANKKSWGDYWSSAAKGYREQYEIFEKAESKQQQKLFGLALSVKRGETPRSEASADVLKIVDSMSEKKIRDFAKTSHEGLPKKVQTKEEAIREALLDKMFEKIEEQSLEYYESEDDQIDESKRTRQERRESNKGKKGYDAQGKSIPKVSKTQVIHDVDDNLADQRHPDAAKIDLLQKIREENESDYEKVGELTPSQFAHHKKKKNQKYGFPQFGDTRKFIDTTKPTEVSKVGDSPKRPASKSIITARGPEPGKPRTPMDDTKGFVDHLRKRLRVRGLKRKDVHFTGGMSQGSGPEKKGVLVKKIVKPDAKSVIVTDDHLIDKGKPGNVRHMAAAASEAAPKAKVRAYQSRPATKKSGKIKPGDIVPVRVGKEGDLNDPKIGIRQNINPPSSPKENQRRRKTARRGMGESYDDSGFRQHSSSITSSSNSSNTPSKTASLMSRMRELGLMSPPKKKKRKK